MFCSKCGKEAKLADANCSECGNALNTGGALQSSQPKREDFYRAFIGPKNQEYYLRVFEKFDSQGKVGVSWHWPAFFLTFYWLLYRKMWGSAALYFFSPYIIFLPLGIVAGIAEKSGGFIIAAAWLLYLAVMFLGPPLYANALYYRLCKRKINLVAVSGHSVERQLGELTGRGGTSKFFLVIASFVVVAVIGILAAIAIPAYQERTMRAQTIGAAQLGKDVGTYVAEYYYRHQRVPDSLAQAGYKQMLPDYVKALKLDSQTGVMTITMGKSLLTDKSLYIIPSLGANGKINWICKSEDILPRYLPSYCKEDSPKQ